MKKVCNWKTCNAVWNT